MRRREFIGLIGSAAAAWSRGARAQQPDRMRHLINLKTAKALGLAVPITMQMTADEVIE